MSEFTTYPLEDLYSSVLQGSVSASDTELTLFRAVQFASLPGGNTMYLHIDYDKPSKYEIVSLTALAVDQKTCTITRAAKPSYYGGTAVAYAHSAGAKVLITHSWQLFQDIANAIATKIDKAGGVFTGAVSFSGSGNRGLTVSILTTVQINALSSPPDGTIVYDTTTGEFKARQAGAWVVIASGSTQPNASTTVAGKVETATEEEAIAGTDTGGTGALMFVLPSTLAKLVQNNSYSYATTSGSASAYVLTLTPAPSAYQAGQEFTFVANHTSTTTTPTLNVNGLGVENITHPSGQPFAPGDILSGVAYKVVHNGTSFDLVSVSSRVNPADLASYTTAEAIDGSSVPKLVSILGDNAIDFVAQRPSSGFLLDGSGGGDIDLNFGDDATRARRSTPFIYTNALATARSLVRFATMLQKVGSPGDNVVIAVQADSAGSPDGTDIVVAATFTGSDLIANSFHVIEKTIAGASLTSGSQYHMVLRRSGSIDAVNYYSVRSSGSAGSGGKVFNAGTGTWANSDPFQMYLTIELDYGGGKIALANGSSNYVANAIGFTKSNVASGGTAAVQISGEVTGFSGLTPGADYYASTAGDISTTRSNIYVGKAKNATTLITSLKFSVVQNVVANTYTIKPREGNSIAGQSFTFVLLTGFSPMQISWSDWLTPSASSQTRMGESKYSQGQSRPVMAITGLDSSDRTINAQSTITNESGAVGNLAAVYDNGFTLSYTPSFAGQQYFRLSYDAIRT